MDHSDQHDTLLWATRAAIYAYFATTGRRPTAAQIATTLGITPAAAVAYYHDLHARHAILLAEQHADIRMANPFAGSMTGFRVRVGPTEYWANCAWDALGIPAALHCDALIEIDDPVGGPIHRLTVTAGQVTGTGIVHFLLPFRRWYDDLVDT